MPYSYTALATRLIDDIQTGRRLSGERLPSVREGALAFGVSTSTMVRCYRHLEAHGWVQARSKSGVYVADWKVTTALQRQQTPGRRPSAATPAVAYEQWVGLQHRMAQLYALTSQPLRASLHLAHAAAQWYPVDALARVGQRLLRSQPQTLGVYPTGTGLPEFKQALVQWLSEGGLVLHPDEVLVTNGATEALAVALRAVAQAGDAVVVESPVYFGLLQLLESLGIQALEVPCVPEQGISLEALEYALEHHPGIRAVVSMPNFQNPLGCAMSDQHKRRLLRCVERFGVTLIEDDTFGDVAPHDQRATPVKAWDKAGSVIYCGSCSKSLAPAFRVGWVAGGRHHKRMESLKLSHSLVSPLFEQAVLAEFMRSGALLPHLRRLRERLQQNLPKVLAAVQRHFPVEARVRSQGGWWLWIECAPGTDTLLLLRQAVDQGVAFAPGILFGTNGKYAHCLRLNVAQPFNAELDQALAVVGALLKQAGAWLDAGKH